MKTHYVTVERPSQEVEIDFLSFSPELGVTVDGLTVTVKLTYDKHKKTATLDIYAVADDDRATIIFNEAREIDITVLDKVDLDTALSQEDEDTAEEDEDE